MTAHYRVHGLGFSARLPLPVGRRAMDGAQYPIGGPERWQQIVDNLASLAAELDRTFVPAIGAVPGPTPEWYRPERQVERPARPRPQDHREAHVRRDGPIRVGRGSSPSAQPSRRVLTLG